MDVRTDGTLIGGTRSINHEAPPSAVATNHP